MDAAVATILGGVAAGELASPGAPVSIPGDSESAVLGIARMDRIAGHLARALQAGEVRATDTFAVSVQDLWREQLTISVMSEAQAARLALLLEGTNVEWRLTKGAAVAHSDFPDPSLRNSGDVDVMVHPRSWDRMIVVLEAAGYEREFPEVGPEFDQRYGKGATYESPEGVEIDLHRRMAIGRFGVRSKMEDMFDVASSIELAGVKIPILDAPRRLIHGAFHAALGGFQYFRAFRDVAQLLLVTDADWYETRRIMQSWRCEAVLARAIVRAWDRLHLTAEHPAMNWARSFEIARGDTKALAVFEQELPFRDQAWTAVAALPPYMVPRYLYVLSSPAGRTSRVSSVAAASRRQLRRIRRH
jgi:hypothetical protein